MKDVWKKPRMEPIVDYCGCSFKISNPDSVGVNIKCFSDILKFLIEKNEKLTKKRRT